MDLNLHAATEGAREWYAVEVLAVFAVVDGHDVEEHDERSEETGSGDEAQDDAEDLTAPVSYVKPDVRQESEREEEAEQEADGMRVVVDHRKKAEDKEEDEYGDQLADCQPRCIDELPTLNNFNEEARQQAELRTGWTSLRKKTVHF